MIHVTYKVVQHDGGWAYTVNGVFSETYISHAAALAAAKRAAAEQRTPGRSEAIVPRPRSRTARNAAVSAKARPRRR